MRFRTHSYWIAALALAISIPAHASDAQCFWPRPSSGEQGAAFVDPANAACLAFEQELNQTCSEAIPLVELTPDGPGTKLMSPRWEPIPLYKANGAEDRKAFALLKKLVWARAITLYPVEREQRTTRDVDAVLQKIRTAHAKGGIATFEFTSLDLEGRGKSERIYRLYSGIVRNPESINDEGNFGKLEPELFLARAVDVASMKQPTIPPMAAGSAVTTKRADVLIVDGIPYLLTWGANSTVLVYAAYLNKNSPLTPQELEGRRTFIVPLLRCMFDFKPTH